MKTIIISDLHNRVDWIEPFLELTKYDRVVFLGDYFDDFNDTLDDAEKTANWLKKSIHEPNRIHLFGNHDLWYRFPIDCFRCSGNTEWKFNVIDEILSLDDWDMLKLYHCEQNFFLSHAGLHPSFADNKFRKVIKYDIEEAFNNAKDGKIHPLLDAGEARMGFQPYGGITWLDWDKEFMPVHHLNQIVGHTTHSIPQEYHIKYSKNYCLDTRNNHVGILENRILTFMYLKSTQNPYIQ